SKVDFFGRSVDFLPSPKVAKAATADTAINRMTASFLRSSLLVNMVFGWFISYKNNDKRNYKTNRLSRTLVLH
ncbi:MAG TPA: hypothetical protein PK977_07635, partial [Chitinophagaceae bacterium]|nr:hypothetical protein [Chitinophagaceae bacterium]